MGWVKTPTRQPPSSVIPTWPLGVEAVKLQVNFVPLYLPATISPGPAHLPSRERKNSTSRSAAAAFARGTVDAAAEMASGRTADTSTLFMNDTRQQETLEEALSTMNSNG